MPQMSIQQWKSRPIFISSTFRDMQSERDHLRNFVFPRLEEELHKRRHHLEWIDLRQGVEFGAAQTEEQRELAVLKVCLDEIKRSRPFLIVLLGDRYGWVPQSDRMEAAAREAGFQTGLLGKSVTALEIEFGIFKGSTEQPHRCFFYLREPLPYDKVPNDLRAAYSEKFATDDQAPARDKALTDLKAALVNNAEIRPRMRSYKADWDQNKNRVSGLEAWGDDVFRDLWNELEIETRQFGAALVAPSWEENERAALGEFVAQRSRDFIGREETIETLLNIAHSPIAEGAVWGACVSGPPGSGKTALFAELHKNLGGDSNIVLLSNASGATIRGSSIDSMLRRWIAELVAFLGVNNPLTKNVTVEDVDFAFASLLENASLNKRVVLLIDALNQFEPTPRAKYLTWLPKIPPANARLIATTLPCIEAERLAVLPGVSTMELPPVTAVSAQKIAQSIFKRWHVPWSEDVWRILTKKTLSNRTAAVGNPLWTILAVEQLALLDADDFARAEQNFATERDPQKRLSKLRCELAELLPPDLPGLYASILKHAEKIHGVTPVRAFVCAIALSRHGWRESDLQGLLLPLSQILDGSHTLPKGCLYESLSRPGKMLLEDSGSYTSHSAPLAEVAVIRRTFRSNLILRNEFQWDFFHAEARASVLRYLNLNTDLEASVHRAFAKLLFEQRRDDPVRCDELMFHLLEAGEDASVQICYGRNYQTFIVMTADTTPERELASSTATLVDEIIGNGMKRLSELSNSDVGLQIISADRRLPAELEDRIEHLSKELRRDVAQGWCRRCIHTLLPALASVAPISARRSLVNQLLSRLADSAKDFPGDSELKTTLANVQFMAADFAETQGDWGEANRLNDAALRAIESISDTEK
jgi:hypothetical protein